MAIQLSDLEHSSMPVIPDLKDFDQSSGNRLERLVFNHRTVFVLACALITVFLGFNSLKLVITAGFEKMIPASHPFIVNYIENKSELRGLGNVVRVVVENTQGDIFDPEYLEVLKNVNDELFLTPGVDRAWLKSLWTPSVRWTESTEDGFKGGPVMPPKYDGSAKSIEELKLNIARSGVIGSLVANNYKSTMILVPLLDKYGETGEKLDYRDFSTRLEKDVRQKYQFSKTLEKEVRSQETGKIKIHVIGFAKLVGDLIDGLIQVMTYFAVAAVIVALVIYGYTRCVRRTVLVRSCSIVAVIWQLGLVSLFGFELDPYSILVPFLVFAIGVSHGAQKMNGIMQDVARGTHKLVAARYTFRRLFLAGVTALLADAVGFGVLMIIDIPVIRDLALTASIGVAVLIFTNLLLLPVLLSYTGVSRTAAERTLLAEQNEAKGGGMAGVWDLLDHFTERKWATIAVVTSAVLGVAAFAVSLNLKIGDLEPGAPELRQDSRYNKDNAFVTQNFSLSSDQFAVMVKTEKDGCMTYKTQKLADGLAWELQQVPGVQTTIALPDAVRRITAGSFEGNPKWLSISRNQENLNYAGSQAGSGNPDLFNTKCSMMPVIAYLSDHKAETLDNVVRVALDFAEKNNDKDVEFLLAAGSSGIEAATNIVVRDANRKMLLYVYAAVIVLCFITFRSWRAVIVAVVPLIITSILCEALMVWLGIGVKVATLPVIALGVGIGVDYALYLLSVQLAYQRMGMPLVDAYKVAVKFVGKVVALVGITLGVGVVTWALSPIKFQADMGILLTFMFVWNMLGALVLIPALSYFLLRDEHKKVKVATA